MIENSSWLESINYKVFASYTKYRGTDADYQSAGRILEYEGDTPDNLKDYSLGFLVSFSFGDKVFSKTKDKILEYVK